MKNKETPARADHARQEQNNTSDTKFVTKADKPFANCPPAYRRPLQDLSIRFGENHIPLTTVYFVFEGYRFPNKKIRAIITGLVEMGIIELEPMKYIKIMGVQPKHEI